MTLFCKMQSKAIYCFADSLTLFYQLLDANVPIIQFRNKHIDDQTFFEWTQQMLDAITMNQRKTCLIINDRVDIALATQAHGIHIGQQDENYHTVLERVPNSMIIGVSVDTVQEALDAEKAGVTYIGAGAVFPTQSKKDAFALGVNGLKEIIQAVQIPVVAIGGITIHNIHEVINAGAKYFAVLSDINHSKDITKKIQAYQNILNSVS